MEICQPAIHRRGCLYAKDLSRQSPAVHRCSRIKSAFVGDHLWFGVDSMIDIIAELGGISSKQMISEANILSRLYGKRFGIFWIFKRLGTIEFF